MAPFGMDVYIEFLKNVMQFMYDRCPRLMVEGGLTMAEVHCANNFRSCQLINIIGKQIYF